MVKWIMLMSYPFTFTTTSTCSQEPPPQRSEHVSNHCTTSLGHCMHEERRYGILWERYRKHQDKSLLQNMQNGWMWNQAYDILAKNGKDWHSMVADATRCSTQRVYGWIFFFFLTHFVYLILNSMVDHFDILDQFKYIR